MAKREKTEYEIKVNEIKAIIKTMKFDDVVKLRKNVDTIIRDVLKGKIKSQRTQINRENKKLDKLEKELGLEPNKSGANAKK